jgi:hypothetical protein
MSAPSSGLKISQLNQHEADTKQSFACSPETLVDFQRITRRYIPEDRTLRQWVFFFIFLIFWKSASSVKVYDMF